MDTLTCISTRRSVRSYCDEAMPLKELQTIAEYGLYAPSAHNQQAWNFFLISKKSDFEFLGDLMEFWKMIPKSWGVILAAYDTSLLRSPEFIQQDMGAAMQNLLLASHAEGLGAVWVGLYPHEAEMQAIHQHFQLPEAIVPFALVAIGKPAGELRGKSLKTEGKIQIL